MPVPRTKLRDLIALFLVLPLVSFDFLRRWLRERRSI